MEKLKDLPEVVVPLNFSEVYETANANEASLMLFTHDWVVVSMLTVAENEYRYILGRIRNGKEQK